jgi:hypothetical protein
MGDLIHKVQTEEHDSIEEIQMFSLQIANERVEFSAAKFFPIDHSLIFSVSIARSKIGVKRGGVADCRRCDHLHHHFDSAVGHTGY